MLRHIRSSKLLEENTDSQAKPKPQLGVTCISDTTSIKVKYPYMNAHASERSMSARVASTQIFQDYVYRNIGWFVVHSGLL